MKKNKLISIFIVISLVLIILTTQIFPALQPSKEKKDDKSKQTEKKEIVQTQNGTTKIIVPEDKEYKSHANLPIDCKTCHSCEYPTKNDPCLGACPRNTLVTVYHGPEEGPSVVHLKDINGQGGEVVFSHRIHSQMSEMSGGCQTCHHYNTTGPVLKCKTCHSVERKRDDISVPDLEAAYHRQCLNCHRQWNRSTNCEGCHVWEPLKAELVRTEKMKKYEKMSHPPLIEPKEIVYETTAPEGKFVTFFHNEHTNLYGLQCISCHKQDNCLNCHDINMKLNGGLQNKTHKTHKTFQEHHQPCFSCHSNDQCAKCHQGSSQQPFNHLQKTGFDLAPYHTGFACTRCHTQMGKFSGLNSNCTSCHKDFEVGKFNHSKVGITLDDNHNELDCSSCHLNNQFRKTPVCTDCHDDKSYPAQVPGKRVKR
jgi:hypothetical protein